jgi:hypothetical protein
MNLPRVSPDGKVDNRRNGARHIVARSDIERLHNPFRCQHKLDKVDVNLDLNRQCQHGDCDGVDYGSRST